MAGPHLRIHFEYSLRSQYSELGSEVKQKDHGLCTAVNDVLIVARRCENEERSLHEISCLQGTKECGELDNALLNRELRLRCPLGMGKCFA